MDCPKCEMPDSLQAQDRFTHLEHAGAYSSDSAFNLVIIRPYHCSSCGLMFHDIESITPTERLQDASLRP